MAEGAITQMVAIWNGGRSVWVFSLLDLKSADRVLEIGFGPGLDIARANRAAAFVAGVDHSEVMLKQAARQAGIGLSKMLIAAGFEDVHSEMQAIRPVPTVCVLGRR